MGARRTIDDEDRAKGGHISQSNAFLQIIKSIGKRNFVNRILGPGVPANQYLIHVGRTEMTYLLGLSFQWSLMWKCEMVALENGKTLHFKTTDGHATIQTRFFEHGSCRSSRSS
jgi:hypothetical protein